MLLLLTGPTVWMAISPLVIAYFIAFIIQKPISFCVNRLRFKRSIATFLLTLFSFALTIGLLILLIYTAVNELGQVLANQSNIFANIFSAISPAIDWVSNLATDVDPAFKDTFQSAITTFSTWITDISVSFASGVVNWAKDLILNIPLILVYANFLLVGTYFVARDFHKLTHRMQKLFGLDKESQSGFRIALKSLKKGVLGFIKVELIYTVFVFIVSAIVLMLMGYDFAILIAIILAILEFLPLFGNGTILIPWGLIALITGDVAGGLYLLGLTVFFTVVRKITEPKLISDNMDLHPLASLLGMYAGLRLGGIWGLILGPVIMLIFINAHKERAFDRLYQDWHTVKTGITAYLKRRE